MNRILFFVVACFLSFSLPPKASAQSEMINNLRTALKTGSSKELVKNFNSMVELSFDGEKSNYSRSQAELVMKEFFKQHPPLDFHAAHQGASKGGHIYVLGQYSFENGSFRVSIFIKKFEEGYLVDTMSFTLE